VGDKFKTGQTSAGADVISDFKFEMAGLEVAACEVHNPNLHAHGDIYGPWRGRKWGKVETWNLEPRG
jgi:hypothetical protein